jgi:hypothetical protein
MKDIFSSRAQARFVETLLSFLESLLELFPSCLGVKEWTEWLSCLSESSNDKKSRLEATRGWVDAMSHPLKRGCAKYSKAIESIVGSPASVYHSVAYHDISALNESSPYFATLSLKSKVESAVMDKQSVSIFWEYMDDLNKQAYLSTRAIPPRIPTTMEIKADIQMRKGVGVANKPILNHGMHEVWATFCKMRGVVDAPTSEDDLSGKLYKIATTNYEGGKSGLELCRARSVQWFESLVETAPYLGTGPPSNEEEWDLLDRALSLCTMEGSIPPPMMQGIESVANKIAMDIESGKMTLGSLNIEDVGKQVLSNLSPEEMSSFAKNLDKIIPAMQHM